MSLYDNVLKNLLETGKLDLMDCRELSCKEIDSLTDEIRFWCAYGSGKLENLEKKRNKYYV